MYKIVLLESKIFQIYILKNLKELSLLFHQNLIEEIIIKSHACS